ncbi:MAG TPA: glycosyltransferase family 4 protein [Nitrososphaerales archaeon]|nr:glycosyltransferase family 4 protein [Nitrososphaerales archaeon]
MKVKFLVTPVGLVMGNIISAQRLKEALSNEGVTVSDDVAEKGYDILHVHTPFPPWNALEVRKAKKQGVPVVIHAHTTAEDAEGTWTGSTLLSGWVGRYLTWFYNQADLVLVPSEWTSNRLRARGLKSPVEVLSNGINLESFRFEQERRRRFRERYGIPFGCRVAYMVGVVCLKKGVEVFPEVARAVPDMDFIWVGRRSNLYHPFKAARAIGQSPENVRFIHDVQDILDAHCGCDIFFTPSFAENQGLALMEAMAVGRPVVARALPVYEGLLRNERNALLGDSSADFVNALRRLRVDDGLSESLARRGKEAVDSHDLRNVAKRLVSIYDSLLQHDSL